MSQIFFVKDLGEGALFSSGQVVFRYTASGNFEVFDNVDVFIKAHSLPDSFVTFLKGAVKK